MKELKRKVNILSGFYIDFERCCICANNEPYEKIHLTQQQIQIFRFLCLQSDNENNVYVTNEQIFEYLYGRPYRNDGLKPDLNNVTRAMSKLRSKKSKNGNIDIHRIIESDKNGSFKLKLIESPFEFIENKDQQMESSEFIKTATQNRATTLTIVSITGQWLFTNENDQREILTFLNNGGSINVIINTEDVANLLISNMTNNNNFYLSYNAVMQSLKQLIKKYPNQISFKQIDTPILHATLYTDCYKGNLSALIVYVYTYPDSYDLPNYTFLLEETSPYFELFFREIKKFENQN